MDVDMRLTLRSVLTMIMVLAFGGITPATAGSTRPGGPLVPESGALLGAFVDPDDSGYSQEKILHFERQIGRQLAIDMRYYGLNHAFPSDLDRWSADSGRVPLVTWEPFNTTLQAFIDGRHDALIRARARDVRAFGSPIFLRFAHEMNGDWYPWSGVHNHDRKQTNGPDKYVAAWRRVHDLFAAEGATNVVWVWSPNAGSVPHQTTHPWNDWKRYYPGDGYVDWVAVDGYNWGTTQSWSSWTSFETIFRPVYDDYAERKPIMIGEFASTEHGGDKAEWIADLLPTIRDRFPSIAAIVWFQVNKETDWRADSSPASLDAFRALAGSSYFGGAQGDAPTVPAPADPEVASTTTVEEVEHIHTSRDLSVRVRLSDDLGRPVAGGRVTVEVRRTDGAMRSLTASTGADGQATMLWRNARSGCFISAVVAVQSPLAWDQEAAGASSCG
jgi:beta-mannanase